MSSRARASASPLRSRATGLLANLALAVGSVVVVVGALEVGARLAGFQTRGTWSTPCYEKIPEIDHLFIPGYRGAMYKGIATGWKEVPMRANSHGLRGPEFALEKPPRVSRILVLGDSFAFGYLLPEEESFPAILQEMLDQRRGPGRVQVINAGVPGFGIANQRAFLQLRGLAFAPDVVIVAPSPGDVADAAFQGNPAGGKIDVGRDLRLYRAARDSALLDLMEYLFFKGVMLVDPKLSLQRGLHAEVLASNLQRAWDRYVQGFARLVGLAREHGMRVLAMPYPAELDLFSDNEVVQRRWRDLARANDVQFVDLMPAFREERLRGLFLPADGHPTAEGNRIAARAATAALEDGAR